MSDRALLVWDGECGYCRRWVERLRRWARRPLEFETYQDVCARHPELPRERFRAAVHLREPDGGWHHGADAVFRALRGVPVLGLLEGLYRRVPPFAALAEAGYRWVARNRSWLPV